MKKILISSVWLYLFATAQVWATDGTLPKTRAGMPLDQASVVLSVQEQQKLEEALLVFINPYDIAMANQNIIKTLSHDYRTKVPDERRDDSILEWADILLGVGDDWQKTVVQYRRFFAKFPK